jgi:hypothetical protein
MVLHRFGGIYMDLDFKHVRPLSTLSLSGCVIAESKDFGRLGGFIYADAGHPTIHKWLIDPSLIDETTPMDAVVKHGDVTVLGEDVFYSHPYADRGNEISTIPTEAVAIHLWNGHWRGERNVLKVVEWCDITPIVVSLNSNEARRNALNLPFDYLLRLQPKITDIDASERVRGIVGCMEAHKDAIRYAKVRKLPAILVLEDDAVWVGKDLSEIRAEAPITFLGADPIPQTKFDPDKRIAHNVVRTTAVIYRADAYDDVLGIYPTIERLRASNIPVGGQHIDLVLSRNGVKLSKHKLFTHSGAPSSIGNADLQTTTQQIYE